MITQEILTIKELIKNNYSPKKIILFGSYARNEEKEESDIDLLVISDIEKNLPRYKRGLKVRILLSEVNKPKDILFYTENEINEWENIPHSFINTVLDEGITIYG